MSIIDRIFLGKVIKDFGVLEETTAGLAKTKKTVLLVHKNGKPKLVLKSSSKAIFGAGVQYIDLNIDAAVRLKQFIDEAEVLASESR